MVPPAPHPRFQLTVSTTSNQSLLCAVSVSQETGFCVRRQRARKHTVVVRPSLWRPKRGNEARQTWAMRESPGNLLKRRSAWWAREDSNLQPDRYERPALTIELRAPPGLTYGPAALFGKRLAPVANDGFREVDRLLTRHADTGKAHWVCRDRLGRVEARRQLAQLRFGHTIPTLRRLLFG